MYKMKKSGYEENQRVEVLVAGLRGFKRMEEDEKNGIRKLIDQAGLEQERED